MAIVALVLGILGLIVFCWLGPVLGAGWAGALMAASAAGGQMEIATWPVWALGLGIGAGIPLVAVVFGLVGLKREGNRPAVAIAGIVLGVVGILAAAIISGIVVAGLSIAEHAKAGAANQAELMLEDQEAMNAEFEQMQDDLRRALEQQGEPQGEAESPGEQ